MTVSVCYVFPNLNLRRYEPLARRFVRTYQDSPPGETGHDIVVLVNGTKLSRRQEKLFDPLPVKVIECSNEGKDIGAFQRAATQLDSDLMVCLGAHIHFHLPGWLDRIVDVYLRVGPALYGAWAFTQPLLHIRTTAFWTSPHIFNAYPRWIGNFDRYEFEHGHDSITMWSLKNKLGAYMVTRSEVLALPKCHHVHRQDCLFLDQHCESIGYG